MIAVALILFGGANKLPELARGLGRAMGEFKRGQIEIEREIQGIAQTQQPTQTVATAAISQTAPQSPSPDGKQLDNKEELKKEIQALELKLKELKEKLQ